MLDVQADQLGAAKGAGKAEQQQCPGSRIPIGLSAARVATMARTSSVTAGALPVAAVPIVRRIPAQQARTTASAVGVATPAAWCAWLIEEIRRRTVEALAIAARSVR